MTETLANQSTTALGHDHTTNKRAKYAGLAILFAVGSVLSMIASCHPDKVSEENASKVKIAGITGSIVFGTAALANLAFACFPEAPTKINQAISSCMEYVHCEKTEKTAETIVQTV